MFCLKCSLNFLNSIITLIRYGKFISNSVFAFCALDNPNHMYTQYFHYYFLVTDPSAAASIYSFSIFFFAFYFCLLFFCIISLDYGIVKYRDEYFQHFPTIRQATEYRFQSNAFVFQYLLLLLLLFCFITFTMDYSYTTCQHKVQFKKFKLLDKTNVMLYNDDKSCINTKNNSKMAILTYEYH